MRDGSMWKRLWPLQAAIVVQRAGGHGGFRQMFRRCLSIVQNAGRKWTARERMAGMAKQSGYLQRREAELDATFNAGAAMAMQFAMDTLQMALHQTEGWGYDRIMRITHNWVAVQREYKPALDCRNPEADVRQEHMDRVLAEIISGKAELIRFPDRYPNAKKIKYGR
nr:MAG TPA: hypothetical protein [Caudoviricetes sp.]